MTQPKDLATIMEEFNSILIDVLNGIDYFGWDENTQNMIRGKTWDVLTEKKKILIESACKSYLLHVAQEASMGMNKKNCSCACHEVEYFKIQETGMIHDGLCCERMNGSLMNHGIQKIFTNLTPKANE